MTRRSRYARAASLILRVLMLSRVGAEPVVELSGEGVPGGEVQYALFDGMRYKGLPDSCLGDFQYLTH